MSHRASRVGEGKRSPPFTDAFRHVICRCALRGANQVEEDEEAAGGGNGPHVHGGRPHHPAGSGHAGSTTAGDDREAGVHAEAVQQEVFPRPAKSDGERRRGNAASFSSTGVTHTHLACTSRACLFVCARLQQPWPQSQDLQNREVRQQRFAHFTELAIMSVQEIVDFAKQLPGFLELTREDQIALLKTSTIEVRHYISRPVEKQTAPSPSGCMSHSSTFVLHRLCCWRRLGGTIPPSTASRS